MLRYRLPLIARIKDFGRIFFDIRRGEHLRTLLLGLYLLFILFAYYILKPVSRALFLNKFDLDKLPWLYVLLAPAGGLLAYFYAKLAVRSSLKTAVTVATGFSVAMIVGMGYLLHFQWSWIFYAFNIWVSMFSILMVTQGWVIAANVFNSREARRVYGVLGLGAVVGAGFGGTFAAATVKIIGVSNLIYASAFFTLVAYGMFRGLLLLKDVNLDRAKAVSDEESNFNITDILGDVARYKHFQVIVGIISLTFLVDVMVEYQFQAFAKGRYQGDELVAFMSTFHGVYLNLVNFVFQFFLTGAVVSKFGVGGTLQIMPISISLASILVYASPGVLFSSIARLTEAATRYTFNRTGMELLYLPLPLELKNRTKAFLDIFVDRFARGMGGLLLVLLTGPLALTTHELPLVIITLCFIWSFLSWRAQKEYISTIRNRLDTRSLNFEDARTRVNDPKIVELLERTAEGGSPRQAAYALRLLAEAPNHPMTALLERTVARSEPEVRAAVFEVAAVRNATTLLPQAMAELRGSRAGETSPAIGPAVRYALAMDPAPAELVRRLLDHPAFPVACSAIESLTPDFARAEIPDAWIVSAAADSRPDRRALAAIAIRSRAADQDNTLHTLLNDAEHDVVRQALRAVCVLKDRAYLDRLIRWLRTPDLRGDAMDALASFGSRIIGTLGDLMSDSGTAAALRLHLPRVIGRIGDQKAVDTLMAAIDEPDLSVRANITRALSKMRQAFPQLDYGSPVVGRQIASEAKRYFELRSALMLLDGAHGDGNNGGRGNGTAARILNGTIEERLQQTLDRVFRLIGLRYPPKDVYSAFRAMRRGNSREQHANALEFLDTVLDRELKRVVMPMLDESPTMQSRGREIFRVAMQSPEDALRELLQSGDEWLVCCAAAVASESRLTGLRGDIEVVRRNAGPNVEPVAAAAALALQ